MLFNAAKALQHAEKLKEAVAYYEQTLLAAQTSDVRKAIIADIEIHRDGLLLQQGESDAETKITDNIEIIRNAIDISPYERDVWISGAYFHLINALKDRDAEKAQVYLAQAKSIIDCNPELVIRKDQVQKMNTSS